MAVSGCAEERLDPAPAGFEPEGAMVTEYHAPNMWDPPESVYEPGFIPWRTHVEDGTAYVIGYTGGENIYQPRAAAPRPASRSWKMAL